MQTSDILFNGRFTQAQLELLKFFATEPSEEELQDIKQFFIQYLAEKTLLSVDKAIQTKGYTIEEINKWSKEHNRTAYQAYQAYLKKEKKTSETK